MAKTKGLFIGISTVDCIYLVDHPPGKNANIGAERQLICAGGPATNAAITFSALGGKATLASCIGRHPLAVVAHYELKAYGVDHMDLCPEYHSIPTVSSILVSKKSGDRSVVSVNDAQIDPPRINRNAFSLTGYQTALFDGRRMDTAIKTARECRKAGIHTILDGGSWKPGTERLICHMDTAICSAAFTPPGVTSSGEVVTWLHDRDVCRAVITRGEKSIIASENGNRFEVFPKKPGLVIDTLAAGDIFHGAYAYYQSQTPDGKFRDYLEKAAAIAAESCAHFGPRGIVS